MAASKESQRHYEAEFLGGLAPFVEEELQRLPDKVGLEPPQPDSIAFRYNGSERHLKHLKTVVAVYRRHSFPVPRPKALLGHQHLHSLLGLIAELRKGESFRSFRFSAAGKDSSTFLRLAGELERETRLKHLPDEGELLLRFRPHKEGWEVLARLTPLPLSARSWRVCNMEGGLNATLAVAMLQLAGLKPEERFLNSMCGSGTLLVERAGLGRTGRLVGCDLNPVALECARQNLAAAGVEAELLEADATSLPFADGSFDLITADVPWGDAVGTHEGNAQLYPAFLNEAARLTVQGGRLLFLTHEIKLFERLFSQHEGAWGLRETLKVYHGGHYPRAFLLERR